MSTENQIESLYPIKKNHLGRIICLPFHQSHADHAEELSLKWFFLMILPSKEWAWLNGSFVDYLISSNPEAEFYAVEYFSMGNQSEKKVKDWRRSHKKERVLMNLLWHTIDDHISVEDADVISEALNNCLGIEIADPREECFIREKCGECVEWIQYPENEHPLVKLTPKGFNLIKKLLPPTESATEVE